MENIIPIHIVRNIWGDDRDNNLWYAVEWIDDGETLNHNGFIRRSDLVAWLKRRFHTVKKQKIGFSIER